MNIQNKVEGWSKKLFKTALDELKNFYLVNKSTGIKFTPSWYFEKAVDSAHYPDYYQIITNPIDLHSMSRKINGYFSVGSSIDVAFQQILSDMDLMRDNAHTYNVGDANIEVRICADSVRNFFRFVVRAALKLVRNLGDEPFKNIIFAASFMESFAEESEDEIILQFLQISEYNLANVFERAALIKDVGVKNINFDVRNRIQYFTVLSLIEGRKAPAVSVPIDSSSSANINTQTASKRSSSSAAAPKTNTARTSSSSARSTSATAATGGRSSSSNARSGRSVSKINLQESNAFDDDPWENDDDSVGYNAFDDETDKDFHVTTATATTTTTSSRGVKRSRSEVYHFDPEAEEDPFEDFAPSKRKKSRQSSTAASRQQAAAVVAAPVVDQYLPPPPPPPPVVNQRPAWIEIAETIYKTVCKHQYVDHGSKFVIADFFTPVVDQSPQLAEQYLAKIEKPMDLLQIEEMLFVEQSFIDAREFAEFLQLIFDNCVAFNSTSGAEEFEFTRDLVTKSGYLSRYVRWLCLENLPIDDDTDMDEAEAEDAFGCLRTSQLLAARKERETILAESFIEEMTVGNPFTECKKLLKDVERTRTNEERRQLNVFFYPVDTVSIVDYSVYVRQPMDLSTLKYKLDGSEPADPTIRRMLNMHAPRYTTYGQFLDDFRRIFTNAKKYNAVHKDNDTTGLSQLVYDAAVLFGDRLDSLIPKFTLTLVDKVECYRMNKSRQLREQEELQRKQQLEENERQIIKARMMEEMKQKDEKFALDTDIDRKLQKMEKEASMRKEASEKAILERNIGGRGHRSGSISSTGDLSPTTQGGDVSPQSLSPDGNHAAGSFSVTHGDHGGLQERAVALAAAEVAGVLPEFGGGGAGVGVGGTGLTDDRVVYVAGCGALGYVPLDWESEARKKLASRKKAWDLFGWDIPFTQPVTHAPSPGSSGSGIGSGNHLGNAQSKAAMMHGQTAVSMNVKKAASGVATTISEVQKTANNNEATKNSNNSGGIDAPTSSAATATNATSDTTLVNNPSTVVAAKVVAESASMDRKEGTDMVEMDVDETVDTHASVNEIVSAAVAVVTDAQHGP